MGENQDFTIFYMAQSTIFPCRPQITRSARFVAGEMLDVRRYGGMDTSTRATPESVALRGGPGGDANVPVKVVTLSAGRA